MNKRVLITLIACLFPMASVWSQPVVNDFYRGDYVMGPGMMMGGYGPDRWGPHISDITDEQRSKIMEVQREFHKKQWVLMGKMHEQNFQSDYLDSNGKFDEQAARKAYATTENLQRQMFENHIEAQKRTNSILTRQQLKKLQESSGR